MASLTDYKLRMLSWTMQGMVSQQTPPLQAARWYFDGRRATSAESTALNYLDGEGFIKSVRISADEREYTITPDGREALKINGWASKN